MFVFCHSRVPSNQHRRRTKYSSDQRHLALPSRRTGETRGEKAAFGPCCAASDRVKHRLPPALLGSRRVPRLQPCASLFSDSTRESALSRLARRHDAPPDHPAGDARGPAPGPAAVAAAADAAPARGAPAAHAAAGRGGAPRARRRRLQQLEQERQRPVDLRARRHRPRGRLRLRGPVLRRRGARGRHVRRGRVPDGHGRLRRGAHGPVLPRPVPDDDLPHGRQLRRARRDAPRRGAAPAAAEDLRIRGDPRDGRRLPGLLRGLQPLGRDPVPRRLARQVRRARRHGRRHAAPHQGAPRARLDARPHRAPRRRRRRRAARRRPGGARVRRVARAPPRRRGVPGRAEALRGPERAPQGRRRRPRGGNRARRSQLQRLRSRPFPTRFG